MPLATALEDHLKQRSPEEVVRAVADIAHTLASLWADHHIGHRDIKPSNLYWYENQAAVGDFGLVTYPGVEPVTDNSRQIGPRNFTADEMIMDPQRAEAAPADVFSLAKTMWVLLTGNNWPPAGQLRVDRPQLTIAEYVAHPRLRVLDRSVERATHHTPEQRPTMQQFADELEAWLAVPAQHHRAGLIRDPRSPRVGAP